MFLGVFGFAKFENNRMFNTSPDLVFVVVFEFAKFEKNHILKSHFMREMVVPNINPLWERFCKEWSAIAPLHTRSYADSSI